MFSQDKCWKYAHDESKSVIEELGQEDGNEASIRMH